MNRYLVELYVSGAKRPAVDVAVAPTVPALINPVVDLGANE